MSVSLNETNRIVDITLLRITLNKVDWKVFNTDFPMKIFYQKSATIFLICVASSVY